MFSTLAKTVLIFLLPAFVMTVQIDIIGSVRAQILGQALQDTTVCIDRDQIASTRYPDPNSSAINV